MEDDTKSITILTTQGKPIGSETVEVTRGQRGGYGWIIKVCIDKADSDAIDRISEIDKLLKQKFGEKIEK